MTGAPFTVTGPVVGGSAHDGEAEALVAAAADQGLTVVARHGVGRGRSVIELQPARPDDQIVGDGAGDAIDPSLRLARVVAALRARGFAVVAGPPTAAYAGVWARRNEPSWFAPGACVCFPWSPFDRSSAALVVEIDPGAGFGAGGHPTTLGLLGGLVDQRVVGAGRSEPTDGPSRATGSPVPGGLADLSDRRVLDVGCGTGVLAIAAALRGADPVAALDIAPAAVAATRANAVRNGVADRVEVVEADLARCPDPFDLVLANIHADVLVALAPELRRLTACPHGLLGVSGLSPSQPSQVEAALRPLRPVARVGLDDWISLWFRW